MATAVLGNLGAGKTLHTVQMLDEARKNGHYIVTNFWCEFAHKSIYNLPDFLDFLQSLYYVIQSGSSDPKNARPLSKEKKVYIVIDEAGVWFNSRMFKDFPPILLDFFPQMRKMNVELIYTVQFPDIVDVNFRRFTDEYIYYKRIWKTNFGLKYLLHLNPSGPDVEQALNGDGFAGNFRLEKAPSFYRNSSKYWGSYNTFQIVSTEKRTDNYSTKYSKEIKKTAFEVYVKNPLQKLVEKFQKKNSLFRFLSKRSYNKKKSFYDSEKKFLSF